MVIMMRGRRYRACLHLLGLIAANIIFTSHDAQGTSFNPDARRSVGRDGEDLEKSDSDGPSTESVQQKGSTVSPPEDHITVDPEMVDIEFYTDDSDVPSSTNFCPEKYSNRQPRVQRNVENLGIQRRGNDLTSWSLQDIYEKLKSIVNDIVDEAQNSFRRSGSPWNSFSPRTSLLGFVNSIIEPLEPAYEDLVKPMIEPLTTITDPIANREDLADFFDIFLDYVSPNDQRHDNVTGKRPDLLAHLDTAADNFLIFLGVRPPAKTGKGQATTVSPISTTTPEPFDIEASDVESFLDWVFPTTDSHDKPHKPHKPHKTHETHEPYETHETHETYKTHDHTTPKIPVNVLLPIVWHLNGGSNKTDMNAVQTVGDPEKTNYITNLLQKLKNRPDIRAQGRVLNPNPTGVRRTQDTVKQTQQGRLNPYVYRSNPIVKDGPPSLSGERPTHYEYLPSNPIRPGHSLSSADVLSLYQRANIYQPMYRRSQYSAE